MGKGALTVREDARMVAEKDPQKVQEPAGPAFRDMAADAAEFQVAPLSTDCKHCTSPKGFTISRSMVALS